MNKQSCDIGIIGLGVMGQNLLLNMTDHGFTVAGFDKKNNTDIKVFIESLRVPRAILLLVPAGAAVDAVIQELLPLLKPDDLIIDAGNSYFKDTDIRAQYLQKHGIQFLGVGISGGEEGARRGPSIMPGGPKEAYARVQKIFEAVAAKVNNQPCVTYLGPGSAGHFVKMVHNGIEYGIMQLFAESYDFMKRGLNFDNKQLAKIYTEWNTGELSSYLIEITSHIFNNPIIDNILSVAKQNGTGMWTSQSAMELQVPIPTIDVAVSMRDLSVLVTEREKTSVKYPQAIKTFTDFNLSQLRDALFAAMILTYTQGFNVLAAASKQYNYNLDLNAVSRIWQGGCIIRAAMLDDMQVKHQESLRSIVCHAAQSGIPMPAFMASLGYFDAYRSVWSPANLIQAQRDYFGAHTYERIDQKGFFHTKWEKN